MVFLINAGARNIISIQATFITRYEDFDKKPVRYRTILTHRDLENLSEDWLGENCRLLMEKYHNFKIEFEKET